VGFEGGELSPAVGFEGGVGDAAGDVGEGEVVVGEGGLDAVEFAGDAEGPGGIAFGRIEGEDFAEVVERGVEETMEPGGEGVGCGGGAGGGVGGRRGRYEGVGREGEGAEDAGGVGGGEGGEGSRRRRPAWRVGTTTRRSRRSQGAVAVRCARR
jgi:hypothetical protein